MAPPRSGARRGRPSDAVIHYTKRLNRECAERGDVAGARALLDAMEGEGLAPTLVTLNTLLKCYRNARRPDAAETTLDREFRRWGLAPDGCSFCTLIDAYGLSGDLAAAWRILHRAEAAGAADARVYSAIMRFLAPAEVPPLIEHMLLRGLSLSVTVCNAALNAFANAGGPGGSSRLPAPGGAPTPRTPA